jgi:hypothetical protein
MGTWTSRRSARERMRCAGKPASFFLYCFCFPSKAARVWEHLAIRELALRQRGTGAGAGRSLESPISVLHVGVIILAAEADGVGSQSAT